MERDELVRLITAEVERRVATARSVPHRLALLEPGPELPAAAKRLEALADVTIVPVGTARQALEAHTLRDKLSLLPDDPDRLEAEVLPQVESLLVPNLRPGSAAAIALGLDTGTVPRLVQAALWAGKAVVVAPGWSPAGPAALRRLFDDHLERLKALGIEVECCGTVPVGAPAVAEYVWDKKLLTEADLRALAARNVKQIVLPRGAIATALAVDAARAFGVTLVRR